MRGDLNHVQEVKRWEREQRELARRVVLRDEGIPEKVCGIAISSRGDDAICGLVVMRADEIIETKVIHGVLRVPYIPGFRFYREGELIMRGISSLESSPDLFLFQASGIAHPRFLGLASHIGVLMNLRTAGVTKRYLLGKLPELREGEWRILKHEGVEVAIAVRFQRDFSPLIISPGNRVSLSGAFEIVRRLMMGHSLPEPLHEARRLVRRERLNIASQK